LRLRSLVPGVPDECFARPDDGPEVMTRQEVRSVVLGKLFNAPWQPGDTVWDLGAGLGSVSVELAVLRPRVEVVAVEREAARADWLRKNRERFDAYNIRVVQGEMPEALLSEADRPRAVFVGGSGGRLTDVLDFAAERLVSGGRLVASFVTLEHWMTAMQRVREWGWPWEMTEVNVARSDALAGLTGMKPLRGVFILSATRPGGAG
jgi:precorrin-6Y C5,15-methyltransferase (decarboxylating) CbiT subunit